MKKRTHRRSVPTALVLAALLLFLPLKSAAASEAVVMSGPASQQLAGNQKHFDVGTVCVMYQDITADTDEVAAWLAAGTVSDELAKRLALSARDLNSGENVPITIRAVSCQSLRAAAGSYALSIDFTFDLADAPSLYEGTHSLTDTMLTVAASTAASSAPADHGPAFGYTHHIDMGEQNEICFSFNVSQSVTEKDIQTWLAAGSLDSQIQGLFPISIRTLLDPVAQEVTASAYLDLASSDNISAAEGSYSILAHFQVIYVGGLGTTRDERFTLEVLADTPVEPEPEDSQPLPPEPSEEEPSPPQPSVPVEEDPLPLPTDTYTVTVYYHLEGEGVFTSASQSGLEQGATYDVSALAARSFDGYEVVRIEGSTTGIVGRDINVTVYYRQTSLPESDPPEEDPEQSQQPTAESQPPVQPPVDDNPVPPSPPRVDPAPSGPTGEVEPPPALVDDPPDDLPPVETGSIPPVESSPPSPAVEEPPAERGFWAFIREHLYVAELGGAAGLSSMMGVGIAADFRVIRWYAKKKEENRWLH